MTIVDHVWLPEEVRYLEKVSKTCQELSNRYRVLYTSYRSKEIKYKLPTIVMSSMLGLFSFGSNQFGEKNQNKIAIFVGATNIFISIISSIEAFLKLGENMSGSLVASNSYQKLKEKIDVELAIPPEGRSSQGLVFLRECYAEYLKIGDLAPAVLSRNRFITEEASKVKPFLHTPFSDLQDAFRSSYETFRRKHVEPSMLEIRVEDTYGKRPQTVVDL